MDQSFLLLLALAIVVAVAAGSMVRTRMLAQHAGAAPTEYPFAASTEGEKVCPTCGMGNLWTSGRCISCGHALKG